MMTDINIHNFLSIAMLFAGLFGAIININHTIRFIISIETIILSSVYTFAISSLSYGMKFEVLAVLAIIISICEIIILIAVLGNSR